MQLTIILFCFFKLSTVKSIFLKLQSKQNWYFYLQDTPKYRVNSRLLSLTHYIMN